jgi:hypothetical protein
MKDIIRECLIRYVLIMKAFSLVTVVEDVGIISGRIIVIVRLGSLINLIRGVLWLLHIILGLAGMKLKAITGWLMNIVSSTIVLSLARSFIA